MSEQRRDLLVQQCRAIEAAGCDGYRGAYVAKVIGNAADEIASLHAQLASARKALEEALPIVADRCAGGRMLTSKDIASKAFDLINAALTDEQGK